MRLKVRVATTVLIAMLVQLCLMPAVFAASNNGITIGHYYSERRCFLFFCRTVNICEKLELSANASSSSHFTAGVLVAEGVEAPTLQAEDGFGNQLVVNDEEILFEESSQVAEHLSAIHPPPQGYAWLGFSSTSLVTTQGPQRLEYVVDFHWSEPLTEEPKVIWIGDDGDLLNGDLVFGGVSVSEAPNSCSP